MRVPLMQAAPWQIAGSDTMLLFQFMIFVRCGIRDPAVGGTSAGLATPEAWCEVRNIPQRILNSKKNSGKGGEAAWGRGTGVMSDR